MVTALCKTYRLVSAAWLRQTLVLASFCVVTTLSAEPLHFYTEHNPPTAYLDQNGQLKGATVDLIRILQRRLNDQGPIEIYPWARAIQLASQDPNAVLFDTVRNDLREDKFQWAGPLKIHQNNLYSRSTKAKLAGKKQIACAYRDSAVLTQIRRLGYEENRNLIVTTRAGECGELLLKDRVDLVPLNQVTFKALSQQLAAQQDQLTLARPLSESRKYLAFSKQIAPERVARWQQALMQSYRDGTMRRLYQNVYSEEMIRELERFAATQP